MIRDPQEHPSRPGPDSKWRDLVTVYSCDAAARPDNVFQEACSLAEYAESLVDVHSWFLWWG
ncbi:DUF4253 domain-containing protein [Kitasatospora sp. NBC_00374]|uniref:hypothetical protein n=1 Tax=Kitasatospora sp. NBC_00374 TaxID=2975964 RepID=UPI0032507D76